MKKYIVFALMLSGCISSPGEKVFTLGDYQEFCPSDARLKEPSSKEYVVYKSGLRDFYILPGDYILSGSELTRMPQNSVGNDGGSTVRITSIQDLKNYFKNQTEALRRFGNDIGSGVFPREIKNNYPNKKLAKELIVEKYISTENPQIVFCGLTLKSDFKMERKYRKYIAKQHVNERLNDDIYSGDAGKNYFTLSEIQ